DYTVSAHHVTVWKNVAVKRLLVVLQDCVDDGLLAFDNLVLNGSSVCPALSGDRTSLKNRPRHDDEQREVGHATSQRIGTLAVSSSDLESGLSAIQTLASTHESGLANILNVIADSSAEPSSYTFQRPVSMR